MRARGFFTSELFDIIYFNISIFNNLQKSKTHHENLFYCSSLHFLLLASSNALAQSPASRHNNVSAAATHQFSKQLSLENHTLTRQTESGAVTFKIEPGATLNFVAKSNAIEITSKANQPQASTISLEFGESPDSRPGVSSFKSMLPAVENSLKNIANNYVVEQKSRLLADVRVLDVKPNSGDAKVFRIQDSSFKPAPGEFEFIEMAAWLAGSNQADTTSLVVLVSLFWNGKPADHPTTVQDFIRNAKFTPK